MAALPRSLPTLLILNSAKTQDVRAGLLLGMRKLQYGPKFGLDQVLGSYISLSAISLQAVTQAHSNSCVITPVVKDPLVRPASEGWGGLRKQRDQIDPSTQCLKRKNSEARQRKERRGDVIID